MPRLVRIALIVLCFTTCAGTLFALSATPQLPSTTLTTLCSQPCLSDGNSCNSAADCQDVRRLHKACCFNLCVYCP